MKGTVSLKESDFVVKKEKVFFAFIGKIQWHQPCLHALDGPLYIDHQVSNNTCLVELNLLFAPEVPLIGNAKEIKIF